MCQIFKRLKSWWTDSDVYRNWVNMRGKKELFMLITGFVLFIFDLVTDIFVAIRHGLEGEKWWFGLTLFLIIVPLFIVSFMAVLQADKGQALRCCLMFACSSIFVRFIEEFEYWKEAYRDNSPCGKNYKECNCSDCEQYRVAVTKSNQSAYKLAWIRYVETLTESAPQWSLQIYIMLDQWRFPWLTVLSTVFSLLSLAWSITALEKARANKNGQSFTLSGTVVFFSSQLFSLLSRLFAIAGIAYVFKEHVTTVLAVHWLIAHVVLRLADAACKCDDKIKCDEVIYYVIVYIIATFPFLLHVPHLLTSSRTIHVVFYTLLSAENVLFAVLVVITPTSKVKHPNELKSIVLPLVIIGMVLGAVFLIMYNKLFKPIKPREFKSGRRSVLLSE